MANKVYFNRANEVERIKSALYESQINGIDFEGPVCLSVLQLSNNHLSYTINFENSDSSSFVHATLTYQPEIGAYQIGNVTKNTTKPSTCLNESQIENGFSSVGASNRYDYYELTDNVFYHPQIDSILVIFFIIAIVCFYFPYKIFSRAFGRWLKI